jgi:hypothetical protein
MLRFLPILKIHAWGGLGSQLFAVSTAYELLKRFPSRRIKIVLHTGGVTYRNPEVVSLFPGYEFEYTDDYSHDNSSQQTSVKLVGSRIRIFLKSILKILSIVETANNDLEFNRVKFWTLSLRGHYSYRSISQDFYLLLHRSILGATPNHETREVKTCAIHYRLGDLLTLHEKKPIPVELIMHELNQISRETRIENFLVFSDSPSIALERLSPLDLHLLSASTKDSLEVINMSVDVEYFVGTSSKISFWIAGLRGSIYRLPSSLPKSNLNEYKNLFAGVDDCITGYPRDSSFT